MSAFPSFSISPALALYKCGSTPSPISPVTSTLSPPIVFTRSVSIVVVVVTFIFLPDVAPPFPQDISSIIATHTAITKFNFFSTLFLVIIHLLQIFIFFINLNHICCIKSHYFSIILLTFQIYRSIKRIFSFYNIFFL